MSERDILDRLFYFHDGYRRSDLSEGDEIALMIDADEEIRSLRARLEKAEAEREAAYLAGFMDGAEGYNGEYPFSDENPEDNALWVEMRNRALKSHTPDQGDEA